MTTTKGMRLIAIPIARARAGALPVSTFVAQQTPIKPSFTPHQIAANAAKAAIAAAAGDSKSSSSSTKSSSSSATASLNSTAAKAKDKLDAKEAQAPLAKRIMDKASKFWIDLGREDQKSTFDWKRKTYTLGEKLMDRIEYEEWALKGVDPTLGPRLTSPTGNKVDSASQSGPVSKALADAKESSAKEAHASEETKKVALLFPPSILSANTLLSSLTHLTASRQPHHRQRMIWCIIGMPFTIPFIVVPVVPNLPFFYLVWRAWSHWRAFQSSRYLSDLIEQGRLVPTPSDELDRIFALPGPAPFSPSDAKDAKVETSTTGDAKSTPEAKVEVDYESHMILKPFLIDALSQSFNMDRQLSVDLKRAQQQTIKSIKAGQMAKLEKAANYDSEGKKDGQ